MYFFGIVHLADNSSGLYTEDQGINLLMNNRLEASFQFNHL